MWETCSRLLSTCSRDVIFAAIVAAGFAMRRHGLLGGGHDSDEGVLLGLLPARPNE